MAPDIVDLVEPYLSEDPARWARLASQVQWRRMQLLLLREILVELRKLNHTLAERQKGIHAEAQRGKEGPCRGTGDETTDL